MLEVYRCHPTPDADTDPRYRLLLIMAAYHRMPWSLLRRATITILLEVVVEPPTPRPALLIAGDAKTKCKIYCLSNRLQDKS